jgi:hypothetical protein
MDDNYSCNMCVKVTLDLCCTMALRNVERAPSTYDGISRKYEWKKFDLMNYAIVPKIKLNDGVQVDVFVCMDEDDLDDMEIKEYVGEFFAKTILPAWEGYSLGHVSEPTDEPPFEVGCPKTKHSGMGEQQ